MHKNVELTLKNCNCKTWHIWVSVFALPVVAIGWPTIELYPYHVLHWLVYGIFGLGLVASVRCLICDKNRFGKIFNALWSIAYIAVATIYFIR